MPSLRARLTHSSNNVLSNNNMFSSNKAHSSAKAHSSNNVFSSIPGSTSKISRPQAHHNSKISLVTETVPSRERARPRASNPPRMIVGMQIRDNKRAMEARTTGASELRTKLSFNCFRRKYQ